MIDARLEQAISPVIRNIRPYQPGKPIAELMRERGITDVIKLASNENPLGPSPYALAACADALKHGNGIADIISRYPDSNAFALKQKLSAHLGVATDNLLIGNGSNEILEIVAQLLLSDTTCAVYAQHAFVVYALATRARRATGIVVDAVDYSHDLDAIARECQRPEVRVVFIANPNNPTGSWHTHQAIDAFLRDVPPQVLVVLDEAYQEYTGTPLQESIKLIEDHTNLIITRTFSKIYGLAGCRIGYGIADAALIAHINKIRQPFNVNAIASLMATAALDDVEFVERSRRLNQEGMDMLVAQLQSLNIRLLPSRGNFIAFAMPGDAPAFNQSLLDHGMIIRDISDYALPGFFRVTVGIPEENERFIALTRQFMQQQSGDS